MVTEDDKRRLVIQCFQCNDGVLHKMSGLRIGKEKSPGNPRNFSQRP
jgi:hypothetical protein